MELAVVSDLTVAEAKELTAAIQRSLLDAWSLVERAYTSRAWVVLGYESWDSYCEAEFHGLSLPKGERGAVIAALRSAGMSTRAITSATGVSQRSVVRQIATEPNGSVAPIVGINGKRYEPTKPATRRYPPITDPDEICQQFILILRHGMDMQDRAPFDRLEGRARIERASDLRVIRNELNHIIEILEQEQS